MTDPLITELYDLISSPCVGARPFVCRGLPQSCNVMVIGDNPATPMDTDCWSWWNDETGFDLLAFERDYQAHRVAQGSKKTPFSRTRIRLGILRRRGLVPLETNAYAQERPGGHSPGPSNLKLLQLFIARLPRLRAIIAHGREAHDILARLDKPPSSILVKMPPHFSGRGARKGTMSDDIVKALADEVKAWISANGG